MATTTAPLTAPGLPNRAAERARAWLRSTLEMISENRLSLGIAALLTGEVVE